MINNKSEAQWQIGFQMPNYYIHRKCHLCAGPVGQLSDSESLTCKWHLCFKTQTSTWHLLLHKIVQLTSDSCFQGIISIISQTINVLWTWKNIILSLLKACIRLTYVLVKFKLSLLVQFSLADSYSLFFYTEKFLLFPFYPLTLNLKSNSQAMLKTSWSSQWQTYITEIHDVGNTCYFSDFGCLILDTAEGKTLWLRT